MDKLIHVTSKDYSNLFYQEMTAIQLANCIKDLKSMLKKAKLENEERTICRRVSYEELIKIK